MARLCAVRVRKNLIWGGKYPTVNPVILQCAFPVYSHTENDFEKLLSKFIKLINIIQLKYDPIRRRIS